jgi:hypothetical protein
MAKWQASKSDMSPRKGYIPEIDYDDYMERPTCDYYGCSNDASHEVQGRGDSMSPTCGEHCGGCEEEGCDYDFSAEDGTQSDNQAAANAVADAFPGLDDSAKGLMGLSAVSTPRGQRSPLNIPMNWEK